MKQTHGIAPVYDCNSRVLILGSFPSVKSREEGFFYGNRQNRFWRVLAAVMSQETPQTIEAKKIFLLKNGIALWDCIAECDIEGSSDASIKDAVPNDISEILTICPDIHIFLNGKTAEKCYYRHIYPQSGKRAETLPSTSPANASYTQDRLTEVWYDKLSKYLR